MQVPWPQPRLVKIMPLCRAECSKSSPSSRLLGLSPRPQVLVLRVPVVIGISDCWVA